MSYVGNLQSPAPVVATRLQSKRANLVHNPHCWQIVSNFERSQGLPDFKVGTPEQITHGRIDRYLLLQLGHGIDDLAPEINHPLVWTALVKNI